MRIAIVGAGALGSFVGARLAQSGQHTVLVDNDRERVAAINAAGLRLVADGSESSVRVRAGSAGDLDGLYDLLIVLTKGGQTEAAVSSCRHLIDDATYLLTFQNGLGNADILARFGNPDRIVIGMTNWAADLLGPAHVACVGQGEIRIWHAQGRDDPGIRTIGEALNRAGLHCTADPNVEAAIWEKVAFNAAMNSIAAITSRNVGEIGDDPDARDLVSAVAREVLSVAFARSLAVDPAHVQNMFEDAFRSHRPHRPSMLQDVLAGRPTEIETINGAVVAAAARLGSQVPVTETLLRLVRMRERRPTDGIAPVAQV